MQPGRCNRTETRALRGVLQKQLMANRTKQNVRSSRFEWNAAGCTQNQFCIHIHIVQFVYLQGQTCKCRHLRSLSLTLCTMGFSAFWQVSVNYRRCRYSTDRPGSAAREPTVTLTWARVKLSKFTPAVAEGFYEVFVVQVLSRQTQLDLFKIPSTHCCLPARLALSLFLCLSLSLSTFRCRLLWH